MPCRFVVCAALIACIGASPAGAQDTAVADARIQEIREESALIVQQIEAESARSAQFRALLQARISAADAEAAAGAARVSLIRQRAAQAQADAAEIATAAAAVDAETAALTALRTAREARAAEQIAILYAETESLRALTAAEQEKIAQGVALTEAQAAQIRTDAAVNLKALAALRETLASEDPGVRRAAMEQGLTSGNWVLQRAVLAMLLSERPMWALEWTRQSDADKTGRDLIQFHDFNPETGGFQTTHDDSTKSGSLSQGGLVFEYPSCKVVLIMQEDGLLSGEMECSYDYNAVLRLL